MYEDEARISVGLSQLLYNADPTDSDTMRTRLTRMTNEQDKMAADVTLNQTNEIFKKMQSYTTITALIGQMNEAYNSNKYIGDSLLKEDSRVSRLNANLRKEIYKTQQQYLLTTYRRKHYMFMTNIALFTAVVVSGIAVLMALARQGYLPPILVAAVSVIVLFIYIVLMVGLARRSARRRQYHWKQFYWDIAEHHKKEVQRECPPSPMNLGNDKRERIDDLINDIKESDLGERLKNALVRTLRTLKLGHLPSDIRMPTNEMQSTLESNNPNLADRFNELVQDITAVHTKNNEDGVEQGGDEEGDEDEDDENDD